uniref:Uncharacterized protein n=1 Tax=Anguilla anguilla TaxID=7936 RepID=A0A0E9QDK6_ANGAN
MLCSNHVVAGQSLALIAFHAH